MPRLIVLLIAATLVAACATSPLGRRQLKLVSEGQMSEMGIASFTEMKKQIPESKDAKVNAYVQCVSRDITAAFGAQTWEVRVFADKQVNAFALPGGKIGVYTGLLGVATTQDQLAAVIGHEVAHVIAGHSSERVSEAMAANLGGAVVQATTGVSAEMLGMATNVFFLLPHSRTHESEADLLGLDYMAKAGFDPRASVTLWQNMAKASGGNKPPQMLSTHPSDQTRIAALQARMPKALPIYEAAQQQGRRPKCGP